MEERRQIRRAKLAEGITRHRSVLSVMKLILERAPSAQKDGLTNGIQETTNELQRMEEEFHALNVEQIREELKGS